MRRLRAIKSLVQGAGHWIQEAYCSVGQRVGERLEAISDAIAEHRYLASRPANAPEPRARRETVIEVPAFRPINGHKHLH
jgi:hypothetical protein